MMYLYVWVLHERIMQCRPPSGSRAQKKAGNVISVSQDMFWNKGKTKTEASHAFGNNFRLNSHAISAGEILRTLCFCFTPLHPNCSVYGMQPSKNSHGKFNAL